VALAASACLAVAVGSASAAQGLTDLGGWWRFNENTGTTINDSSANANNGTLSGGTWVAGKFGSGLDFAFPGYVRVPSATSLESQTITAEAWVKHSGTPGDFRYILAKGANANFAASYALYSGNGGGIGFYVASCSVFAVAYDGSVSLWDGNWHRVTGTYGGGNVNLYVDGVLVANTPSSLTIEYNLTACGGETNDLSSGDFLGGTQSYGFPGAIDEPRVWTRTLSASDVGDTTAPAVTVSPLTVLLGQASVNLSATATDPYGVVGGEYSLDGGTWTPMTQSDSTLSATIDTHALAVGNHSVQVRATDYAGNTNGTPTSANLLVAYDWHGFFQPVDNLPTLNAVKAGQALPVKFSLSGNQGLNIFATGYPTSQPIICDSGASTDGIEATVTAGSSSLAYDAITDQYTYVWKTDKAWANTCRQLTVKLNDGTTHQANFTFTK
ncbi:MAG TPA: PxKF domain-containing protein, partial [Vicinamibacterales bacterium]|nr:PxKF domain-containing protein [Vicinamibacterales bacterium]